MPGFGSRLFSAAATKVHLNLHRQLLKRCVTGPMQYGVAHITSCAAYFVAAEAMPLATSGSIANWACAAKVADKPWGTGTVEGGSLPGLWVLP